MVVPRSSGFLESSLEAPPLQKKKERERERKASFFFISFLSFSSLLSRKVCHFQFHHKKKRERKERERRKVKDEKKRRAGACRGARVPARSQSPTQTEEKRACARAETTPPSRQGRRCPGFPVSLVMCICVDGLDREHGKLCSWAPSCALTSPGNASRTFTNVLCHVPT